MKNILAIILATLALCGGALAGPDLRMDPGKIIWFYSADRTHRIGLRGDPAAVSDVIWTLNRSTSGATTDGAGGFYVGSGGGGGGGGDVYLANTQTFTGKNTFGALSSNIPITLLTEGQESLRSVTNNVNEFNAWRISTVTTTGMPILSLCTGGAVDGSSYGTQVAGFRYNGSASGTKYASLIYGSGVQEAINWLTTGGNAGYVGIGTNAPTSLLTIAGDLALKGTAQNEFRLYETSANGGTFYGGWKAPADLSANAVLTTPATLPANNLAIPQFTTAGVPTWVLGDPGAGANRIAFWKHGTGYDWLTPGAGLSITGNTLTASASRTAADATTVEFTTTLILESNVDYWYDTLAGDRTIQLPPSPTPGEYSTLRISCDGTDRTLTLPANCYRAGTDQTPTPSLVAQASRTTQIKFYYDSRWNFTDTVLDTEAGNSVYMNSSSSTARPGFAVTPLRTTGMEWDGVLATADDTYSGETLTGVTAGAAIAQWDAVYIDGSGTYQVADADGASTYPARGLAVAAYSSTNAAVIIESGTVRNDAWNWTPGGTIYLSTSGTGNTLVQTAPSTSGNKIQVIGYAISDDTIRVKISTDYGTAP